jgi:hypothetical protein
MIAVSSVRAIESAFTFIGEHGEAELRPCPLLFSGVLSRRLPDSNLVQKAPFHPASLVRHPRLHCLGTAPPSATPQRYAARAPVWFVAARGSGTGGCWSASDSRESWRRGPSRGSSVPRSRGAQARALSCTPSQAQCRNHRRPFGIHVICRRGHVVSTHTNNLCSSMHVLEQR